MTITQMECFIEAAKTGSFGKAGARLYISQQTISRQIKAMEEELGFPLFERTRSGVYLTESGQILYERWKELLVEYRSSVDKARDLFSGEDNKVCVGIIDSGNIKNEIIQGLIRFNERYPDLEVEYTILPANLLLESLESEKNHIAFIPSNDIPNKTELKLIQLERFQEDIGIVFSNNHPLAKRKNVGLSHLVGETIGVLAKSIAADHTANIERLFRKIPGGKELKLKEYDSPNSLQMALVTGKCVSVMFDYIVDGVEDKLQFYPLDVDWADHRMMVAYKSKKYAVKAKNITREFE